VYGGSPETALRTATQVPTNDPFTIVPVMASVTEHLCFGVTGSIPYEPPYSFARKISSLDHLTNGRMGWNIVTGYLDSAAKGVGRDKKETHDTRYDIAHEYMKVVYSLWEQSWTSPKGQAFAGEHAECVFIGGNDAESHARSVARLREQAVAQGRDAHSLNIFGAITVIVADTDQAAEEKLADYKSYGLQDGALALLSGWSGMDFSTLDMDATVEKVESDAIQSALMAQGSATVREWAENLTVGGAGPIITGAPSTIADKLERWFTESGLDGFNLAYTVVPECIDDFVDQVVPVLQERGVYKTTYQPGTFREKITGGAARLQAPHSGASYRR